MNKKAVLIDPNDGDIFYILLDSIFPFFDGV